MACWQCIAYLSSSLRALMAACVIAVHPCSRLRMAIGTLDRLIWAQVEAVVCVQSKEDDRFGPMPVRLAHAALHSLW